MIDPAVETMIQVNDVPDHLPKVRGKRMNICTVYRWIQRGLCGVQLETYYIGGVSHTSKEALARFDHAVTIAKNGPRTQPSTAKQSSRAHEKAMRKLASV